MSLTYITKDKYYKYVEMLKDLELENEVKERIKNKSEYIYFILIQRKSHIQKINTKKCF